MDNHNEYKHIKWTKFDYRNKIAKKTALHMRELVKKVTSHANMEETWIGSVILPDLQFRYLVPFKLDVIRLLIVVHELSFVRLEKYISCESDSDSLTSTPSWLLQ